MRFGNEILTKRHIPHDEAKDAAQRLFNSHFRQEPCARIGIPARPDYDDDLVLLAYIEQQRRAHAPSAPAVPSDQQPTKPQA